MCSLNSLSPQDFVKGLLFFFLGDQRRWSAVHGGSAKAARHACWQRESLCDVFSVFVLHSANFRVSPGPARTFPSPSHSCSCLSSTSFALHLHSHLHRHRQCRQRLPGYVSRLSDSPAHRHLHFACWSNFWSWWRRCWMEVLAAGC